MLIKADLSTEKAAEEARKGLYNPIRQTVVWYQRCLNSRSWEGPPSSPHNTHLQDLVQWLLQAKDAGTQHCIADLLRVHLTSVPCTHDPGWCCAQEKWTSVWQEGMGWKNSLNETQEASTSPMTQSLTQRPATGILAPGLSTSGLEKQNNSSTGEAY